MDRKHNLGLLLTHLCNAIQRELDSQLKKYRIDSKHFTVLCYLWEEEGVTQTVLSARCDVAHYTMTRLLDQLQSLGLIRKQQETDKRAYYVFLTDDGKALETDVIRDVEQVFNYFLKTVDTHEQQQFLNLLNKIESQHYVD